MIGNAAEAVGPRSAARRADERGPAKIFSIQPPLRSPAMPRDSLPEATRRYKPRGPHGLRAPAQAGELRSRSCRSERRVVPRCRAEGDQYREPPWKRARNGGSPNERELTASQTAQSTSRRRLIGYGERTENNSRGRGEPARVRRKNPASIGVLRSDNFAAPLHDPAGMSAPPRQTMYPSSSPASLRRTRRRRPRRKAPIRRCAWR